MPVFTTNIPFPLKVGDRIHIAGKIAPNARKMSVNLCAQEGEEPRDVVMHFDVRFRHDNIVSLSRKDGVWIGSGNHDTNYNMFVPGTVFRIEFLIREAGVVTVYCQGKFHSNFVPKVSLEFAKFLVAWCDVEKVTHCYFLPCNTHFGGDPEGRETTVVGRCLTPSPVEQKKSRHDRTKSPPRRPKKSGSPQNRDIGLDRCISKVATTRASRYFYDTLMGCGRPETPHARPDRRDIDPIFQDMSDLGQQGESVHRNHMEDNELDRQKIVSPADTSKMGKLASFFAPRKPREQNVRPRARERRRHREGIYN